MSMSFEVKKFLKYLLTDPLDKITPTERRG